MLLHRKVSVTMQLFSTITSKGQVLIPATIRNKLNMKPSDRVIFNVTGSKLVAEKATSTDEMYGFIKTGKKLSNRQLENAINRATEEGLSQHP